MCWGVEVFRTTGFAEVIIDTVTTMKKMSEFEGGFLGGEGGDGRIVKKNVPTFVPRPCDRHLAVGACVM